MTTPGADPLRIDTVAAPGGGAIALAGCPGVRPDGSPGDLAADLAALRAWGASALVTLLETRELLDLGVVALPGGAADAGLAWHHLPFTEHAAPDDEFEFLWHDLGGALLALLRGGGRLAVHGRNGLGRTGTVAARLLVGLGVAPITAINSVREARPGAIEDGRQESWLLALPRDGD